MIFLTIGSHEPFDRLVRTVDAWCADRGTGAQVYGQITARAEYAPEHFDWVANLEPQAYKDRCRAARFIISHAGMGSIITAMSFGKPILLMPRRGHLGETRNDHQYTTARKFDARPGIFVAEDETELPDALDRMLAGNAGGPEDHLSPWANDGLIDSLRRFIHQTPDDSGQ